MTSQPDDVLPAFVYYHGGGWVLLDVGKLYIKHELNTTKRHQPGPLEPQVGMGEAACVPHLSSPLHPTPIVLKKKK